MRFLTERIPLALATLLLAAVCAPRAQADDEPAKPTAKSPTAKSPAIKAPAGKTATKESGDSITRKWDALIKRREEIGSQLASMQQAFKIADAKGRKEMGEKYDKLMKEFHQDVNPAMLSLAPQILKKDPKNVVAAEAVVVKLYDENKYAEIIAAAAPLLEDENNNSPVLLNMCGVAYFAMSEFEKAQAVLERAQKFDKQLFPDIGARYIGASAVYPEFWKKEQEIRAKEAEADDLPRVLFKTTRGDIVIELFENEAPNTVANFISLVENKKYDGTAFHRVIPNFMAQGGDPNTLDDDPSNDGQGSPGYKIACECYRKDARRHFRASLSMAHAGKDTGGSQFFITHLPTPHLDANPVEQKGHTVFGRVIDGLDVAAALQIGDKIEKATVLRKRDHEYVPEKITTKGTVKKADQTEKKSSD